MPLIECSVAGFSLHGGDGSRLWRIPPDIWVDGKKLYQYRTTLKMDDGERQRYTLTHDKLLDPYEFVEESKPVIQYIVQIDP